MCGNQTLAHSSTDPRLQSAQLPVVLELVLVLVGAQLSVALVLAVEFELVVLVPVAVFELVALAVLPVVVIRVG
jgi:hypothetical protein